MKKILTGLQPTGAITLGNYIGAISQMKKLQDKYDSYIFVANMHAITVPIDPEQLRKNIKSLVALYLACGIDKDKNTIFVQSDNLYHANLSWVLECNTYYGELSRMTQFKDKSRKHADNINAGLFTYPALMAADILLYQADKVPVGADQMQHLEITRDIATRFNGLYGNVFKIPEGFVPKNGARVMSLQNPSSKMSKSDENVNGCVYVLDKPETIMKKFKRAITDTDTKIYFSEDKPGISNLMTIYGAVTGNTMEQIEKEFDGKGYGDFKTAVGEAVVEHLRPIQDEYNRIIKDRAYMEETWKKADAFAQNFSQRTLDKVMKKIGYIK